MENEAYLNSRKKYELRNQKRMEKVLNGEIPKHILIAGVPRSGKTTACSMLANAGKFQHLCMDAVISSFEENFPGTGITTYTENPDTMVCEMSKKVTPFINSIVKANNYDKLNYKLVIDVLEIVPEDFVHLIDNHFAEIYFFGTPDLTPKQNFEQIRKYDTENDYTYYISDEDLMKRCERFFELSKYLQEECKKYHLNFINTSYDRAEKLKEFVEKILSNR